MSFLADSKPLVRLIMNRLSDINGKLSAAQCKCHAAIAGILTDHHMQVRYRDYSRPFEKESEQHLRSCSLWPGQEFE